MSDLNGMQIPAHLQALAGDGFNDFAAGIGGSRGPHISFDNGAFFLIGPDNSPKLPLTAQGAGLFDLQTGNKFIDVVMVAAAPGLAKTYYATGYTKGSAEPPDCWSNDGILPDGSIAAPPIDPTTGHPSASCAVCPMDRFGSLITPAGKEAKACSDRKKLAVLFVHDIRGPLYEFSVSPSNLKGMSAYSQDVAGRVPGGVRSVVTRITADPARVGGVTFSVAPNPATANAQYPMGTGYWFVPETIVPILLAAKDSQECRKAIGADVAPRRAALAAPQHFAPVPQLAPPGPGYAPQPQLAAPIVQSILSHPGAPQQVAEPGAAQPLFDPLTGQRLVPVAPVAAAPQPMFDPMTGQPLVVQHVALQPAFDPMTGQPIQAVSADPLAAFGGAPTASAQAPVHSGQQPGMMPVSTLTPAPSAPMSDAAVKPKRRTKAEMEAARAAATSAAPSAQPNAAYDPMLDAGFVRPDAAPAGQVQGHDPFAPPAALLGQLQSGSSVQTIGFVPTASAFDPMTGQPIQPAAPMSAQPMFDPMTGQPIQQAQAPQGAPAQFGVATQPQLTDPAMDAMLAQAGIG